MVPGSDVGKGIVYRRLTPRRATEPEAGFDGEAQSFDYALREKHLVGLYSQI
jgi:hypothetical protein